jgi:hypothetical protein
MAMQMIDIGLKSVAGGEDLAIVAGDFSMVESTAMHQQQLILNNKGDFKQNPTICIGAFDYLDDENFQNLIRTISVEFTKDGMDVKSVGLTSNGTVKSDAFYQR